MLRDTLSLPNVACILPVLTCDRLAFCALLPKWPGCFFVHRSDATEDHGAGVERGNEGLREVSEAGAHEAQLTFVRHWKDLLWILYVCAARGWGLLWCVFFMAMPNTFWPCAPCGAIFNEKASPSSRPRRRATDFECVEPILGFFVWTWVGLLFLSP